MSVCYIKYVCVDIVGRTPQIGTKRVSVTSQKTIFFPFRFSKIEITNIKYTCHNEEKR